MTVANLKDSHRPWLLPALLAYTRNATYYTPPATALLPSKLNVHLQLACEGGVFFAFLFLKRSRMPNWPTGYNRCPHHHIRQDDDRVTTLGISLLGPVFMYFANTNRYSANTSSFETFYGSEYFILKCGVVHYFSWRQLHPQVTKEKTEATLWRPVLQVPLRELQDSCAGLM